MARIHSPSTLLPASALAAALLALPAAAHAADLASATVQPVQVDLREVAARAGSIIRPMNMNVEIGAPRARVSAEKIQALKAAALALAPHPRLAESLTPVKLQPTIATSFASITADECCGGSGTSVPPDMHLAVGPSHIIAMVNSAFEIYNKSGTSLAGPITTDAFMGGANANCTGTFDPNVLYDEEADRFVMAMDTGTYFCVAFAAAANPVGSWNLYAIPAQPRGGEFCDYPHFGVGDSYIVGGTNQFGGSVPGGFEGRVWALDKAAGYAGSSMTYYSSTTGGTDGTPQPLNLHGVAHGTWPSYGSTHYFVTDEYDGCTLNIWKWVIPAAPSIVATRDLCTATGVTGGFPVDAPQLGSANKIQANDWRFRGFEYRNGSGWIADSISCNPGGGTVDCARWAEIDLKVATPTLVQSGIIASAAAFRIFPNTVADGANNMGITYGGTTSAIYPSIIYTARENSETLGTVQTDSAALKSGEVKYTSFDTPPYRWGDYSNMTIDPNGFDFWFIGEYSKAPSSAAAAWATFIGNFRLLIFSDGFERGNPTHWSSYVTP